MKNNRGNVKECKLSIKRGYVQVNDEVEYDFNRLIGESDVIVDQYGTVNADPFVYYMLNKPKGYICANHDEHYLCVTDLIDRDDCFCIGRLDKDTTGFVFLTNDKSLSKRLSHPQYNKIKKYLVETQEKVDESYIDSFFNGIMIDNDVKCKRAKLEIIDDYHCYVSLSEGKYHQVKKMFLSCNNKVLNLKRVSFCGIDLDISLKEGEYRSLSHEEKNKLFVD